VLFEERYLLSKRNFVLVRGDRDVKGFGLS